MKNQFINGLKDYIKSRLLEIPNFIDGSDLVTICERARLIEVAHPLTGVQYQVKSKSSGKKYNEATSVAKVPNVSQSKSCLIHGVGSHTSDQCLVLQNYAVYYVL